MRPFTPLALTVLAALCVLGIPGPATAWQEEPKVRDLTDSDVTSTDLIDALKPKDEVPRIRGNAPAGPPKCEFYRQQLTRGLAIKSAADPVALTVLFEFNSAAISPQGKKTLDALGEALRSSRLAPCCFQLEGHTDDVGSDEYNKALSRRRSESVARYLAERSGVARERLLTAGFGESRPIDSNDSERGRQKNRRVQLVNLGYGTVEQ